MWNLKVLSVTTLSALMVIKLEQGSAEVTQLRCMYVQAESVAS